MIASIRRLGVLQPISVRYLEAENVYQIISGERRYQACKAAGLAEIPCWVQTPQARDVLLRQIAENWQRADLNPYELADALATLRDINKLSQKDLARETGKPESEISRLLSLLNVNDTAQKLAREADTDVITRRHMINVARLDADDQAKMVLEIEKNRLTALETERTVKERLQRRNTTGPSRSPLARRFRFKTSKATVIVEFRRRNATDQDILDALTEVRQHIGSQQTPVPVSRQAVTMPNSGVFSASESHPE